MTRPAPAVPEISEVDKSPVGAVEYWSGWQMERNLLPHHDWTWVVIGMAVFVVLLLLVLINNIFREHPHG